MKIIFMGTPEFAVPALQKLIDSEHSIICVYTQPAKPKGRGLALIPSPIQVLAEEHNIPVRSPKTLRTPEAQDELRSFDADIIIVAAYGLILPKPVLEMCRYGAINIHSSILPRWRGAAPIHHAILAGDECTGVTIMQMDEGLDTGDILAISETVDIEKHTKFQPLHDQLAIMGANLLMEALGNIDNLSPTGQDDSLSCYASKITKDMAKIDFTKPAIEIVRQINALSEMGCTCNMNNEIIKIYDAEVVDIDHSKSPGEVIDFKKLIVATGQQSIQFNNLQRPGKKIVSAKEFINGIQVNNLTFS